LSGHDISVKGEILDQAVEKDVEFVYTSRHASWLNLVESFFGEITKQMLRNIQVKTREESVIRIYKYFNEANNPWWYTIGHGTWVALTHLKPW